MLYMYFKYHSGIQVGAQNDSDRLTIIVFSPLYSLYLHFYYDMRLADNTR